MVDITGTLRARKGTGINIKRLRKADDYTATLHEEKVVPLQFRRIHKCTEAQRLVEFSAGLQIGCRDAHMGKAFDSDIHFLYLTHSACRGLRHSSREYSPSARR